jgi:hypothetical protein
MLDLQRTDILSMTKKEYRNDDNKPSEMFLDSLSGFGVGSPDLTCGWCDRLHLCPDASYYRDEEDGSWKEYCKEEYENNPEGTVLHYNCDCVSGHEMNGIIFVVCCPCNGLSRYEKFIWNHKNTIQNYLKARTEQEHQWDEEELTVNKLAGY